MKLTITPFIVTPAASARRACQLHISSSSTSQRVTTPTSKSCNNVFRTVDIVLLSHYLIRIEQEICRYLQKSVKILVHEFGVRIIYLTIFRTRRCQICMAIVTWVHTCALSQILLNFVFSDNFDLTIRFSHIFRSVKKPSYECFLEKCNLKFWNADDRKQHSINEHSFPADFKFDTRDKNGGSSKSKKKSKPFKKDEEEKMDHDDVAVIAQKSLSSQGTKSNGKSR